MKESRLLLLLLPLCLMALSACSELHVMGKATMREFSCEAINVEQASYRPIPKPAAPETTKVAKAAPPARPKEVKERKKGLWEHL